MSVKVLALGGKGIARAGRRSVVGGGPFFTSVSYLRTKYNSLLYTSRFG